MTVAEIPPLAQTSQSPAESVMLVIFLATDVVTLTPGLDNTALDITSPTSPAVGLSAALVPIIPPVVGLNANEVAVAAPKTGVIKVGEVVPANFTVPIAPASPTFTELFVATYHLLNVS